MTILDNLELTEYNSLSNNLIVAIRLLKEVSSTLNDTLHMYYIPNAEAIELIRQTENFLKDMKDND